MHLQIQTIHKDSKCGILQFSALTIFVVSTHFIPSHLRHYKNSCNITIVVNVDNYDILSPRSCLLYLSSSLSIRLFHFRSTLFFLSLCLFSLNFFLIFSLSFPPFPPLSLSLFLYLCPRLCLFLSIHISTSLSSYSTRSHSHSWIYDRGNRTEESWNFQVQCPSISRSWMSNVRPSCM